MKTAVDSSSSTKKTLFRPNYTSDLLHPVKLEVVFSGTTTTNEEEDDIVLYSCINDNTTAIHPCWNHLQERIEAFQDTSGGDSIYAHLQCKLIVLQTQEEEEVVVARIPLHPSKLRRLPLPQQETNNMSSIHSWESHPPPTRLPPNALVVKFSDGSTRVCPPLYHFLLEQDVIVESNRQDISLLQDEVEEYKQTSRFDEDVFDILDSTNTTAMTQQRTSPPLSLLETDDESQAVVIKSLKCNGDYNDPATTADFGNDEPDNHSKEMAKLSFHDETKSCLPIELEVVISDLQREKRELDLLVAQEEACLQEELAELHEVSCI